MTIRVRKENDFVDVPETTEEVTLTLRDMEVLRGLWVYNGFLADYQIQALFFPNTSDMQMAKLRLMKMWRGGYILRLKKAGTMIYGCNIYWLTKKGASIVDRPPDYPYARSPLWAQLSHDLVSNDVTITMMKAVDANPDMKLLDWLPEIAFRADPDTVSFVTTAKENRKRRVEPDQFFYIERSKDGEKPFGSRLLVEVDLVQHRMKRLANEKFLAGTAYLRSDAYANRFGAARGRWLFVTPTMDRLTQVKEAAEQLLGKDAEVWHFGLMEELTSSTILTEPVWYKGRQKEPVSLFPS